MLVGASSSVALDTLLGFTRLCAGTRDNVSAFSDAEILALLNQKQKELQTFIISKVLNDWKENTVEGTGVGLISLLKAINYYSFPTGMLTLDRVEINYTGQTNGFAQATVRPEQSIETALANTSDNNTLVGSTDHPVVWARNGKIYVDPIPYQAVANGMKVYCSIVLTDLAIGASEAGPPFPAAFHDIVCRMAALEWLGGKDKGNKFKTVFQIIEQRKAEMVDFYMSREESGRKTMSTAPRNFK